MKASAAGCNEQRDDARDPRSWQQLGFFLEVTKQAGDVLCGVIFSTTFRGET
jgi:hypothetical protein